MFGEIFRCEKVEMIPLFRGEIFRFKVKQINARMLN